jgi:hypothetical protein
MEILINPAYGPVQLQNRKERTHYLKEETKETTITAEKNSSL